MIIKDIISWLNEEKYSFQFHGDENDIITGFCSLDNAEKDKILWIKKQEFYEKSDKHSCIITAVVQNGLDVEVKNQIRSDNSKEIFFAILHHFWGTPDKKGGIGKGTIIENSSYVHPTACIGYNCFISCGATIGANTVIENNVSILHSVAIGEECIIHSGAVIGADGFGFSFDNKGMPQKVEHFGGVVIGNRVEIGGNTCVDRGTIDNTIIEDDVKIDNLVHIAHNVHIGKGALIVAGAVICGSAVLGEKSYVAPGGIVKNQMKIGENALVGLGAVVIKDVGPNAVMMGVPAKEIRKIQKGDK